MHTHDRCLNCDTPVTQAFCPACGQKTNTHRITLVHFLFHDLLHGVWHLEKGILFTIKEALFHPGRAAANYIAGKRVRYYNIFYLTLLVFGFIYLVGSWKAHLYGEDKVVEGSGSLLTVMEFIKHNLKIFVFAFVPLMAFNAWLMLRRLKYNFAEHNIVCGFLLLATMCIIAVLKLRELLPISWQVSAIIVYPMLLLALVPFFYPIAAYGNISKKLYKPAGLAWRFIVIYALFFIEFVILVFVAAYIATGNLGFSGKVSFS